MFCTGMLLISEHSAEVTGGFMQGCMYSVLSIYGPRNVRFSVFTIRHLSSRIKFHLYNVIYFRIHRFSNSCFPAFIDVNNGPDTAFLA
jgi:hypothetical protein